MSGGCGRGADDREVIAMIFRQGNKSLPDSLGVTAMKKETILICCTIAMLLTAMGFIIPTTQGSGAATQEKTEALRVGTFDSRGVALAYGRSARPDCLLAKVAELRKEHEQARKEGNEDRMKELEMEPPALQEQIHKQVFSGAPIDDILALIKDDLPKMAEAANVKLIVSGVLHSGSDVKLVDITQEMCAPFDPDDETQKMIKQIIAMPPVEESELSHDH